MKKFLALALVMLMAVPFMVFSSADVPAEPSATASNVVFTAHDNRTVDGVKSNVATAEGGATADVPFKTSTGWGKLFETHPQMLEGGKIVLVGKGYFDSKTTSIPATAAPLVITAFDGTTDWTSVDAEGNIYFMDNGKNAGQYGMFMLTENIEIAFDGDVIFDRVVILSRISATSLSNGKKVGVITVNDSIVIKDTVQFAEMSGNTNYVLNIADNAYAYLHNVGFSKYTGTGTIVLDRALAETGVATRDMFEGFEGRIIDENGNDPFVAEPDTTEPADTTPETTEPADTTPEATEPADTTPEATEPADTTPEATEPADTTPEVTEPAESEVETEEPGNVPTGDLTSVVLAVAVVALIACAVIVVLKKRTRA